MTSGGQSNRTDLSSYALRAGLALSDLDFDQLWAGYLGLGGAMSPAELHAAMSGEREISDHEHDTVAQALNDHFVVKGQDHPVSYSDDLEPPRSEG
jgi:hypothetical protein